MHQNIAVIVWQFNYGKNSFAVLVPERRRCCQLGSHFFYYFFPCPSVFTIFPHPPRRRRRQCTNKSCPMSSAFYSFSLYIYFSLSLSLSLCISLFFSLSFLLSITLFLCLSLSLSLSLSLLRVSPSSKTFYFHLNKKLCGKKPAKKKGKYFVEFRS